MIVTRIQALAHHLRQPATLDHFQMDEYLTPGRAAWGEMDADAVDRLTPFETLSFCGSYGCIAGHAVLLADPHGHVTEVYSRAKEWLGLTPEQASELFRPDEELIDWDKIDNLVAADVLDHLWQTGEVVWPDEVWLAEDANA